MVLYLIDFPLLREIHWQSHAFGATTVHKSPDRMGAEKPLAWAFAQDDRLCLSKRYTAYGCRIFALLYLTPVQRFFYCVKGFYSAQMVYSNYYDIGLFDDKSLADLCKYAP